MRRNKSGALTALLLVTVACARPELANLRERVQPHMQAFNRFERWASRTLSADLRDHASREAALFAPLQLESQVLGVRVEASEEYTFRDGVQAPARWQRVRVGSREVEVGLREDRVLLRRARHSSGRIVVVEMAFAPPRE